MSEITTSPRALGHDERLCWLRLARTDTVGGVMFDRLLQQFGSAPAALDAIASGRLRREIRLADLTTIQREYDAIQRHGARLVAACEPEYPELLRRIDAAPPVITVIGRVPLLHGPGVAVVGSRNASANGQRFAAEIAHELGKAGIVVNSGLARGIDGRAHEAALTTGTVAVLAGGADSVYPPQHARLYQQIAEQGAIVSERPWGSEPLGKMFPRRNRIISGLSLGVLVIEAARRSGTLITAQRALEQNREVFAVPGFPFDPRSHGTNQLIRDGAVLTETIDDIMAVIDPLIASGHLPAPVSTSAAIKTSTASGDLFMDAGTPPYHDEIKQEYQETPVTNDPVQAVLLAMSATPTAVDEIIRSCNLSARIVNATLTELELTGRIARQPGNRVVRLNSR